VAVKIHDEPADDLLPAEVKTRKPVGSQAVPYYAFCGSWIAAEFLRSSHFRRINPLTFDDESDHEASPFYL
jgi:hypothetical protein